jgi:hypothetical protein
VRLENAHVTEEYAHGRRDGLRLALAVLEAEEAKWAALIGESPSWRTNQVREVRRKTLEVAQKAGPHGARTDDAEERMRR